MACTARGRTPKAKSGRDGDGNPEDEALEVLHASPEILKPYVATGNSARDRVAQWIYMRASEPGIKNSEIAERMGIATASLNTILYRARREGWLQTSDPFDQIELQLIPKIVENLNTFLDEGDRTVTIEAMKGFLVPMFKDSKGIEENKIQVLGIKIEMPEEASVRARGLISGQPRQVGPVIEAEFTKPEE